MVATVANLSIMDSTGAAKQLRVVDISGVGNGPFIPVHALAGIDGVAFSEANPLPTSSLDTAPSEEVIQLTIGMISDTVDLTHLPRALRIFNGSASKVTLMVVVKEGDAAVPVTVPAGAVTYELMKVTRIEVSGSTGLITSGAITTGVEVLLCL